MPVGEQVVFRAGPAQPGPASVDRRRDGVLPPSSDGHFLMCVRRAAHVVGEKPSRGPDVSFESRMRTVAGVVAISTQFELSPLWDDLRQRMVCTGFLLRLLGRGCG